MQGAAKLPGPGDVVDGKYRLERLLGQGGMGAVYAARHVKLGHAVAIKLMLEAAGNVDATRRFLNEGRAAVNIQHDNVVRGSDLGEENGYAFMVLELLDGEDLDQILEREIRLAPNVAVNYAIQALRGVGQAHAQGIVHRDLKPANLFLAKRPDGSTILKVLDFGISKANSSSALDMAPQQLTSTATMLGSPLYMSPEQLRSSKKVDARADIWAMGVILYELMTGERPFNGETLGELFSSILETEAPRVSTRIPSVPQGLDAIVARCLQRRPEDRYQTAAELERDLAPFNAMTGAAMTGAMAGSPLAFSGMAQPNHHAHLGPNTGPHPMPGGLAGGAVTGPSGASGPYGQQSNPLHGAMPAASSPGAMAGSSPSLGGTPNPAVMPGTVPLGAMSPVGFQQTTGSGSAWQSGSQPSKASSSKGTVAFLVICSLAMFVGGGLLFYVRYLKPTSSGPIIATSAPSAPASVAIPVETVALPVSAAPSVVPAPTAPPSASVAAVTPTIKHHGLPAVVAPKPEPPKPQDPPKTADAPKPADPPKTPPRPPPPVTTGAATASPQQNSR